MNASVAKGICLKCGWVMDDHDGLINDKPVCPTREPPKLGLDEEEGENGNTESTKSKE